MRYVPRWLRRVAAIFTWDARDREMDREMAFHIEALTRDFERAGLDPAEAARAARRRFGDVQRLKERGHDVRTAGVVEQVLRDARYASRGLRRNPGFAAAVLVTLALGIGGNTAIFSVVDQVLLRPLPYPQGDRLVTVYEAGLGGPGHFDVSPANWLDWQRDSRTFASFAAWRPNTTTLTGAGEPTRVAGQAVSAEFFPLLAVRPLLGRTVSPEDDRPNAPRVAVISYELWQRAFGGDAGVVGRSAQFDDRPVQIIGVMPAGFRFLYQDGHVWFALRSDRNKAWRQTDGRFYRVVGRLREGATVAGARREMEGIAARLASTHAFNKNTTVDLVPLREELTGQVETSLWVLYAAVAVLLSIACFNVANLLLARAASRQREIAVRTSLGAGRAAITRQLLVESMLLAVVGGVLGAILARISLGALTTFLPPNLLRVGSLTVDWRVLLYAMALSTLTGVVVGLAPALLAARRSVVGTLRASGSTVTASKRLRQALVVGQVAMTAILLCGAGLLVRTLVALDRTSSGFDRHGVLTMAVGLPDQRYPAAARVAFFRDLVARMRALPGVESAAAANSLPVVESPRAGTAFHLQGTPLLPINDRPVAVIRIVTPGFFQAMRIPVVAGREFADADLANPMAGFVVNEAFAKAYLSGANPLQGSLSVAMQRTNPYLPVLGVVGDVSEGSVRDEARPTIFYSHAQLTDGGMTLVLRGSAPEGLAKAAVAVVRDLDRNLAVTKIRTLDAALAESVARERLNALVSGAFAVGGLLLASLGLYALLAYIVSERTREFGIRIALGEGAGRLMRSVVGAGLRMAGLGAVLGVGAAVLLLRTFENLLFGVTAQEPSTYLGVFLLLTSVSAIAAYIPARRAACVEPLRALRQD
jgi:putative ABC transport system permease protein